ncbi:MAG: tetratricopeptide repeat protein [Limisphaerales bacterium]
MLGTLNPGEEAQLRQTIEMFEVITQSQPQDYQSLEILKEAYLKLNLEKEVVLTSKRIAQAYVQLGQLSSAILEYETILQRHPEDRDAMAAMAQIESKANNLTAPQPVEMEHPAKGQTGITKKGAGRETAQPEVDDGRGPMHKFFVESKLITEGDFQACWPTPDLTTPPTKIIDPFIQNLAERQIMSLDKSLKLLADRSRLAYIPLERYEIDMDMVRMAPRAACQRWCVMPVDRMSKTMMVATANPFNKQAMLDLEETSKYRLLWYLASPTELLRILGKTMR